MQPNQPQAPVVPPNGNQQEVLLSMTGPQPKEKTDIKRFIPMILGGLAALNLILALVFFLGQQNSAKEVATLKKQITDGGSIVIDGETIIPSSRDKNPVISATYPNVYNINYSSNTYEYDGNSTYSFTLSIRDGKVHSCDASKVSLDSAKGTDMKQCKVTDLSGDIYKLVEIIDASDHTKDMLGFVMTDGTVDFVQIYKSLQNMEFKVAGKIDAGGFVTDAFTVKQFTKDDLTGEDVAIFVLADGSFKQYKKSMLHYN